jgi:hypothetical protein
MEESGRIRGISLGVIPSDGLLFPCEPATAVMEACREHATTANPNNVSKNAQRRMGESPLEMCV